jgi:hypothetical protein
MGLRPAHAWMKIQFLSLTRGESDGDSVVGLLFSEHITEGAAGGEDWFNSLLIPHSVDYYADRPPV